MRTFAILVCVLVLGACDTSSTTGEEAASFEARVSGAISQSLSGTARPASDLSGTGLTFTDPVNGTVTSFLLEDSDSPARIGLMGLTQEGLSEDTYPMGQGFQEGSDNRLQDAFIGVVIPDGDTESEDPITVGISTGGSVTITEVTDTQVRGTFAFDAGLFDFDGLEDGVDINITETVRVEGSFTSELSTVDR